ncbi:MAG TPA: BamA/TamA family outer membrane protein [Bacteroidota bacterium]
MPRTAFFLFFCFFVVPRILFSQETTREYEVDRIVFDGNRSFDDAELKNLLQTRETPGWFWKAMYAISEKIGEKAEFFDPIVFETDYLLLKQYYEDNGFFHAVIDTTLSFNPKAKRVQVTVTIREGSRSLVDSLRYMGLVDLPDELLEEIQTKRVLQVGDPFVKQQISEEMRRIITAFLNYGYVNVQAGRPEAIRYASTNNMTLLFTFIPGQRYHFGRIEIEQDSLVAERVGTEVILRHLDFAEGDYYSETKKVESERNLNRLGVFERVQIEHLLSQLPDTSADLPVKVFVRPRSFHEIIPEFGVNDEKNAFNLQFGFGYNNRNFFGGARNLSTRLRLSIQSIQDLSFSSVFGKGGLRDTTLISTVELSTQMIQPFFITNKVSLIWTVSALVEKEKYYSLPILRNRIGFNWHQAQFTRIFIDWNLERVSFSPLVANIDSSIVERLTLDRRPQFNSVLTFTMQRDKRNDLFSPSGGFFHSGTLEESGFLPAISGGLFGSDLPYSRYVKFSAVGQWYWDPGKERKLIWAFRARGGFAELYGNSPAPVPFPRRFFAGGSGSIRGWKARALGALSEPSEGGTALLEANLEARWYLLKNAGRLWFLELPKLSLVFFYDAGNVWSDLKHMRASEIAMAAGFGIRFDTIAGPLRIDYGFRAYDPFAPAGQRWVIDRRFFPETFSNGILHFGVGHAF